MDLKEKIKTNTWDSLQDFLKVFNNAMSGSWHWYKNSRCKYVELRVDMRTGHCIISDRYGKRIDPRDLAFQYPDKNT